MAPVLAENLGIREVLSRIKAQNLQNVDIETDSLQLVQWMRSTFASLSYLGRLVEDCKEIMAGLRDQNVLLWFVKRSSNKVAHYLARHTYFPANGI